MNGSSRFEHPSFQAQDELWQLTIGLNLPEGANLTHGPAGNPAIRLAEYVPYPRELQGGAVNEILLNPVSKSTPNLYAIPQNSTTLMTILNEAAGTTDSFEISPDESRTIALLSGVLEEVSAGMRRLAEENQVLPTEISYEQILVMKDILGFKLLPPLRMQPVETQQQLKKAWTGLKSSFMDSLRFGATTPSQWHLIDALQDPVKKAFKFERGDK